MSDVSYRFFAVFAVVIRGKNYQFGNAVRATRNVIFAFICAVSVSYARSVIRVAFYTFSVFVIFVVFDKRLDFARRSDIVFACGNYRFNVI